MRRNGRRFLSRYLLRAQMLVTRGKEDGTYEQEQQTHREREAETRAAAFGNEGLGETVHEFELRRFRAGKGEMRVAGKGSGK